MPTNTTEKTSRATNDLISERLNKIDEFLDSYRNLDNQPHCFTKDEWKEIVRKGIKVNQLYMVMCGNINNDKDLGILKEKLTVANFKRLLKTNGYKWNPYVTSPFSENELTTIMCLLNYFRTEPFVKVHLEPINNTIQDHLDKPLNSDSPNEKFCISIYFKHTKYTSAIAEHLYDLFSDKILGIIPGIGMIQIYVSKPIRAKNLQKKLTRLLNEYVYNGVSIEF